MDDDDLEDEVSFWLHMIEWWESNKNESAPPRMHQALALARFKAEHVHNTQDLVLYH